jgi:hypothetical protein
MTLAKRLLVALGLAGFLLAAGATTASATPNVTCAKASVTFTQTGIATFPSSTTGDDCTVQLSSWSVPDTYDGKGFDASAEPQVLFDRTVATLTGETQTVSVKIPPSRWCQIDYRAANGTYLYGHIVECHPIATVTGKPPVLTPPKHVTHVVTAHRTHLPKTLAFTGVNDAVYVPFALLLVLFGGLLLGFIKPRSVHDSK